MKASYLFILFVLLIEFCYSEYYDPYVRRKKKKEQEKYAQEYGYPYSAYKYRKHDMTEEFSTEKAKSSRNIKNRQNAQSDDDENHYIMDEENAKNEESDSSDENEENNAEETKAKNKPAENTEMHEREKILKMYQQQYAKDNSVTYDQLNPKKKPIENVKNTNEKQGQNLSDKNLPEKTNQIPENKQNMPKNTAQNMPQEKKPDLNKNIEMPKNAENIKSIESNKTLENKNTEMPKNIQQNQPVKIPVEQDLKAKQNVSKESIKSEEIIKTGIKQEKNAIIDSENEENSDDNEQKINLDENKIEEKLKKIEENKPKIQESKIPENLNKIPEKQPKPQEPKIPDKNIVEQKPVQNNISRNLPENKSSLIESLNFEKILEIIILGTYDLFSEIIKYNTDRITQKYGILFPYNLVVLLLGFFIFILVIHSLISPIFISKLYSVFLTKF